jgi:hypothetical protein
MSKRWVLIICTCLCHVQFCIMFYRFMILNFQFAVWCQTSFSETFAWPIMYKEFSFSKAASEKIFYNWEFELFKLRHKHPAQVGYTFAFNILIFLRWWPAHHKFLCLYASAQGWFHNNLIIFSMFALRTVPKYESRPSEEQLECHLEFLLHLYSLLVLVEPVTSMQCCQCKTVTLLKLKVDWFDWNLLNLDLNPKNLRMCHHYHIFPVVSSGILLSGNLVQMSNQVTRWQDCQYISNLSATFQIFMSLTDKTMVVIDTFGNSKTFLLLLLMLCFLFFFQCWHLCFHLPCSAPHLDHSYSLML